MGRTWMHGHILAGHAKAPAVRVSPVRVKCRARSWHPLLHAVRSPRPRADCSSPMEAARMNRHAAFAGAQQLENEGDIRQRRCTRGLHGAGPPCCRGRYSFCDFFSRPEHRSQIVLVYLVSNISCILSDPISTRTIANSG